MSTMTAPPRPQAEYAPEIPARNLPPVPYPDLPDAAPLRCFAFFGVFSITYGVQHFKQLF